MKVTWQLGNLSDWEPTLHRNAFGNSNLKSLIFLYLTISRGWRLSFSRKGMRIIVIHFTHQINKIALNLKINNIIHIEAGFTGSNSVLESNKW